jgi:hypothetical protein
MDYADDAERHRHLAEEYRAMADCTPFDGLRIQYLRLSEVYDALAEHEDQVALDLKHPN